MHIPAVSNQRRPASQVGFVGFALTLSLNEKRAPAIVGRGGAARTAEHAAGSDPTETNAP
jgi:hypothetical protein